MFAIKSFVVLAIILFINSFQAQGLLVGEKCQLPGSDDIGTCRAVKDCPGVIQDLKDAMKPSICFFEGPNPVVCCAQ